MEPSGGPFAVLRRVLANRDLRRVLPAYLAFNAAEFGTWVAILLYAYEQTGPASVGLVALAQLVPAALVAPAAAALGDRMPRERVLAMGYTVQASAMLGTAAAMLAGLPVLVVYVAAAATATSLVVTRPTQSALLPSLARTPDELTASNGAAGVVEGGGVLLGPLAAAAILAVSTPSIVFLFGGVALALAAAATIRLRPSDAGHPDVGGIGEDDAAAADGGFLEGLRTVAADPDARLIVGMLTARMFMIGAADVLFVLLALDLLDIGEPGAGILSAALGAGAIGAGALTFALVGRSRLAAVAAGGAVVWGIALAVIGLTATAWLAPLLVVVGGSGLAIVDIAGRTMLQRSVRDEVLSRVFGLQEGLAMFGLAAGSVVVPVLVGIAGIVGAVLLVAAVLPAAVVLTWGRLASLDRRTVVPVREIALLRRSALFRPLPAPQLEAVARRTSWVTVPAGTVVIREGEVGDRFYVLAAGAVRIERDSRYLRDIESPGQGFGEIALLRGVPRTATVTATRETVLLTIDRAPFLGAVTGHPGAVAAAEREVASRSM
jgi:MFS family permease